MTLATHAITGAAVASLMPSHPFLGFCAGFASHFAIDAIPHWDYPIYSASIHPQKGAPMRFDGAFMRDAVDFSADALLGLLVSLTLFASPADYITIICGVVGGILPDPLQFAYTRFPRVFTPLQRFHEWIHTDVRLTDWKRGVALQLVLVVAITAFVKYIFQ